MNPGPGLGIPNGMFFDMTSEQSARAALGDAVAG